MKAAMWCIAPHTPRIWKAGKLDCSMNTRLVKSANNYQNKDIQIHFKKNDSLAKANLLKGISIFKEKLCPLAMQAPHKVLTEAYSELVTKAKP